MVMMEGDSKTNLLAPSHIRRAISKKDDRKSHIDLTSVGFALSRQIQGSGIHSNEALSSSKEDTTARDYPVQTMVSHPQRTNAGTEAQYTNFQGALKTGKNDMKTNHFSPWKIYKKGYDLKLDQLVMVAVRKAPLYGKVAIRSFAGPDTNRKLDMLRKIRHERFVALLDVFDFEKTCYIVFEHIVITLAQLVNSPAYPTELQLAAIVGQVLEGLDYLASEGMQHGFLTCSSVLVKPDGEIKLANQECCIAADRSELCDVKSVGYITMELMQKYAKDDGAIGIENLNRWRMDSDAVQFLSSTTSAGSVAELRKHALLRHLWRKEDLELLVELASISVHRAFKYDP